MTQVKWRVREADNDAFRLEIAVEPENRPGEEPRVWEGPILLDGEGKARLGRMELTGLQGRKTPDAFDPDDTLNRGTPAEIAWQAAHECAKRARALDERMGTPPEPPEEPRARAIRELRGMVTNGYRRGNL